MADCLKVKAVVLDWAGTAVDYGCFAPVFALQKLFKTINIDLTQDEANKDMGLAKIEHLRKILQIPRISTQFFNQNNREATEDDVTKLYQNLEPCIMEQIPHFSKPIDGVVTAIQQLRSRGIKIGSTTGYTRQMLDLVLSVATKCGYEPDFSIASDQVSGGRPHPWMMIKNQEALGVYPVQSFVKVGDTLVDIQEGKNFGCWTVGILEGSNLLGLTEEQTKNIDKEILNEKKRIIRKKFEDIGADVIIERIGDLPVAVDQINRLLASGGYPGGFHRPYKLFTPGPITTSQKVKLTMMTDWGSRETEYEQLVCDLRKRITKLVAESGVEKYTTVLVQGSGTFCVEAVIGSAIGPNHKLLVLTNGQYGLRIAKIAKMNNLNLIVKEFPEDYGISVSDLPDILKEDDSFTHVAFVHSETTTGLLNDAKEICDFFKKNGKKIIVDAISSIGAVPLDAAEWGVDFIVGSANKGLQSVPGFGFVVADREAIQNCSGISKSLSLDLHDQWVTLEKSNSFRFTSPTHTIRALETALDELEAEGGLKVRFERYSKLQRQISDGLKQSGFELLPMKAKQGPVITTFIKKPNLDFQFFYHYLKNLGLVIYPGKIAKVESFRIGSIGYLFEEDVTAFLEGVKKFLKENPNQRPDL